MLDFKKGPLGYAIIRDGVVIGAIKDRSPRGWSLRLDEHRFPVAPGSVAAYLGHTEGRVKLFRSCRAAMAEAERLLKGR